MKHITQGTIVAIVLSIASAAQSAAQLNGTSTQSQLEQIQASGLQPVSKNELPKFGTFWFAYGPGGMGFPPLPFPPDDLDVPIYDEGNGQYLIDDSQVAYPAKSRTAMSMSSSPPSPGDGDSGGGDPPTPPPNIPNYAKFMAQTFSLLDTNAVAQMDTNLYNVVISFPNDTNTGATLQIARYQANTIIIKANHFDYSAETVRDFALLVCDKVETPTWKSIDVSTSNSQDGWVIQGTVPSYKVTDPMFLMVSNISHTYNAFFQAIPYGGPQVQLAGPQPYETVSNMVTIQATITDLSGVTNEQLQVTVDGYPPRYSAGASNTVNIDTRYNNAGNVNVYVTAFNTARVYDPANPPDKAKLSFSTIQSLPLDFENDTYVAFASDMCSPDVGTNYMLFVISKAQQIAATITDPSNGQTVASYGGYVPYPATVEIPWNFTEADGTTPYSNDTYVVTFTAFDPTTLVVTNTVDRAGVRIGAGTFMTYQWEDPGYPSIDGQWLDDQADTWIKATLASLYNDLYSRLSLTQYYPWMVGANRNRGDCYPRDSWSVDWPSILNNLGNSYYSELTLGPAHGSGAEIGGHEGDFLPGSFSPLDLKRYVENSYSVKNWRLRKANLWTCYSGNGFLATGGYYNTAWPDACGIRPSGLQENTYMRKNCGLFFSGEINQRGYAGGDGSISCAKVVETCDQIWVCGQNMYPGGCDPTYSFRFAVNATRGMFNPELDQANPLLFGYKRVLRKFL